MCALKKLKRLVQMHFVRYAVIDRNTLPYYCRKNAKDASSSYPRLEASNRHISAKSCIETNDPVIVRKPHDLHTKISKVNH